MIKNQSPGSTPKHAPEGQPQMDYAARDHSFALQSIMEQQKALGSVEKELSTLKTELKEHSDILREARDKSIRFEVQLGNVEKSIERVSSDFEKGLSGIKSLIEKSSDDQRIHLDLKLATITQSIQHMSTELVKIDKSVEELKSFRWKFAGGVLVAATSLSILAAIVIRLLFK